MRNESIKRWNPLLGEWVIFAPVTDTRPWNGAVVTRIRERGPKSDPGCHLCPGMPRSGGAANPAYAGPYVFDNDFPSLNPAAGAGSSEGAPSAGLPRREADTDRDPPADGICRVVCFSPLHNVTLAEMGKPDIEAVLEAFAGQFRELSARPGIEYVMLFENKGKEIGVSNPHPHGQIYATDFIPRIPATMYRRASEYSALHGKCLFCGILKRELADGSGVVHANAHFAAYVPAFARFKYEVHLVPLRHVPHMAALSREEMGALADIYRQVLIRYDNLFGMIIPNITVFYNSPTRPGLDVSPWHFHIQFAPPLRSADKLKYLAGFETGGGNIINPSLPRVSAGELRGASGIHFTKASSS